MARGSATWNVCLPKRVLLSMFRFWLLEFIMAVWTLGFAYGLRRILGRLLHGPMVIVWGAVFGLIAVVLGGMFFSTVWTDLAFLDLQGDLFRGAWVFLVRFWDTGLIGGILGALVGSLTMLRRKQQTQKQAQQPPQVP